MKCHFAKLISEIIHCDDKENEKDIKREPCLKLARHTIYMVGLHNPWGAIYIVQIFPDFLVHKIHSVGILYGIPKPKEIPNSSIAEVIRSKHLAKCLCPNNSVAI